MFVLGRCVPSAFLVLESLDEFMIAQIRLSGDGVNWSGVFEDIADKTRQQSCLTDERAMKQSLDRWGINKWAWAGC
jgi:hypothetical protein